MAERNPPAEPPAGPGPGWLRHSDQVRYSDLDAMGHLGHAHFLRFFESARVAYLSSVIPGYRPDRTDDSPPLVASCHIEYRSPAHFEELIHTYVRPARGTMRSFVIEFQMLTDDGRLIAEGNAVMVGYDHEAGRSAELNPALRQAIAEGSAEPAGETAES